MSFFNLIYKRESVRGYLDKVVEREKIEKIIDAARVAPSACNSQPWKFVVVDSEKLTKDLAKTLYDPLIGINKFTTTSKAFIVVVGERRNLIDIPKNKEIYLVISVGYFENKEPRKKVRKNIEEVISYNKYK